MKCETCNGVGEVYYSCCTGEIVNNDWHLCPECKEHLGLEMCEDCDGTGFISDEKDLS